MADVDRGIHHWEITMQDILQVSDVLNLSYDWESYGREFRPMREFMPDKFSSPFAKEVVLTSRLVVTVFNDLSRCQNYIIKRRELENDWYPVNFMPTYTEIGATCIQTETWSSSHPPLPDRATIGHDDEPMKVTNRPSIRLPGDVKCAHKFQASWRAYADPTRTPEMNKSEGTEVMKEEYQKVVAQLNHYMDNVGGVLFEESGRYGYVITDEEVVLLKRTAVNVKGMMGSHYVLHASRGFPLRRKNPAPGDYISGMLALLWIHILVGCEDKGQSYAMARPGWVNLDE